MKKLFLILLSTPLLLTSCEYILKPKANKDKEDLKNIVLGNDKDKHGCVTSAGYRWSEVKQNCIRVFEEGLRLVPVNDTIDEGEDGTDQARLNAYFVIDSIKKRAEVFIIADTSKTIVLNGENDNLYKNNQWVLSLENQFKLSKNGNLKYVSPVATERKSINSDVEESNN